MRRATAVVAACFCAITGCRGGAAQEPYDGRVVTAGGPSRGAPVPTAPAPDAEPMASEVDVPWAIALLSDVGAPLVHGSPRVVVVDHEPTVDEHLEEEANGDLEVAADHDDSDERRQPPKSCSGVVNRRS